MKKTIPISIEEDLKKDISKLILMPRGEQTKPTGLRIAVERIR